MDAPLHKRMDVAESVARTSVPSLPAMTREDFGGREVVSSSTTSSTTAPGPLIGRFTHADALPTLHQDIGALQNL